MRKVFLGVALLAACNRATATMTEPKSDAATGAYDITCAVSTRPTPTVPFSAAQTFSVRSDATTVQTFPTPIGDLTFHCGSGLLLIRQSEQRFEEDFQLRPDSPPADPFSGGPTRGSNVALLSGDTLTDATTFHFNGTTSIDGLDSQVFDRGDIGVTFGFNYPGLQMGGSLFIEPWNTADHAIALESLFQFGRIVNQLADGTFTGQTSISTNDRTLRWSCTQNDASGDGGQR